jgi:biotin carboxylase
MSSDKRSKSNKTKAKIAIIGASYLQLPLISKAKQMGIETHVFAWKTGDVGETEADFFYPISIIEKDEILEKCRVIGIDGVCSIASDLASITVNFIADRLDLIGNSTISSYVSTNKHAMRKCFEEHGIPSPKSIEVDDSFDHNNSFSFPVIVKPVDRSGSRGITKVMNINNLRPAIEKAVEQSFCKKALVEEFVDGNEYSCESISWKGKHKIIAFTRKFTTGAPHFIETGHFEPAFSGEDASLVEKISSVIIKALDSLGIEYGASHS